MANVNDVKGVAASAATGKLYVAYRTLSAGMIYCLDLRTDAVLWNKAIDPDVDRLSINPDGRLLYVPTFEGGAAGFIRTITNRFFRLGAKSGQLRQIEVGDRGADQVSAAAGMPRGAGPDTGGRSSL